MADQKISQDPEITDAAGDEKIPVVKGGNKWISVTNLFKTVVQAIAGKADSSHDHSGVYAPSLGVDDNYVTDAEKAVIANTSGINTGDIVVSDLTELTTPDQTNDWLVIWDTSASAYKKIKPIYFQQLFEAWSQTEEDAIYASYQRDGFPISVTRADLQSSSTFAIANSSSTSSVENIALSGSGGTFSIADLASVSSIENIVLTMNGGTFAIADASSSSIVDNLDISGSGTFSVNDASSASSVDSLTMALAGGQLSIADAVSSSSEENVTLETILTPVAPTITSTVIGSSELNVNWNALSNITSYNVYYSTSSAINSSTYDGTNAYPGTANATAGKITGISLGAVSRVIAGLTNGTGYYIAVAGVNAYGVGSLAISNATPTSANDTTFIASTLVDQSSGANVVFNKPAGTVQNDLMIAYIYGHYGSYTATSVPSGWTLLSEVLGSGGDKLLVYYKIAGASEPSSYTWTMGSTTGYAEGIMATYRGGFNLTTPIDSFTSPVYETLDWSLKMGTPLTVTNPAENILFFGGLYYLSTDQTFASMTPSIKDGYGRGPNSNYYYLFGHRNGFSSTSATLAVGLGVSASRKNGISISLKR